MLVLLDSLNSETYPDQRCDGAASTHSDFGIRMQSTKTPYACLGELTNVACF